MVQRITAVVGSYRKGGTIDSIVSEILSAAGEAGAETHKIYLVDKRIEFCTNCRACTQEEGPRRGKCVHDDEMAEILGRIDSSHALVLGSPVNFFNLNALTRRFLERTVCYAYWPWGAERGPSMRSKAQDKQAVLVTSSAMPALMGRFLTGAPRALKIMAKTLGAKPVATLYVGLAAVDQSQTLSKKAVLRARRVGRRLAR